MVMVDELSAMYFDDLEKWEEDGRRHGWKMPTAPRWKCLPVIRHVRAMLAARQIDVWDTFTAYEQWVGFCIHNTAEEISR